MLPRQHLRKVSKVQAKVLGNQAKRKEKCLRWSMKLALGGTLKVGVTINQLRKRRVLNLMANKKQDVLVLNALVYCPDVPCLPGEPCVFDKSLGDDDGLYVEDHFEEFDLRLTNDLICCCLNSNSQDMHDFLDMWLDCSDLGAWTF